MICLSGEQDWCIQQTKLMLEHYQSGTDILWVGEKAPPFLKALNSRQAFTHLGRECELLVYNAFSGFDPDALGALSGTLKGGGLLFLLTPPLQKWHHFADPQAERIAPAGYTLTGLRSCFLERLSQILATDPSVIRCTPHGIEPWQPLASPEITTTKVLHHICRTLDQVRAVEAILKVAHGHRKRPLVLIADRGRGKSSALGIAAAQLIQEGRKRILVTAPSRNAVESLFDQFNRTLSSFKATQDTWIKFMAPDHLLAEPKTADLLFVDEAAAIPTHILQSLLATYPRIVFSTTVHGYEGTGLGFNHRFKKHLDQERPQWREITLKDPIRWNRDDPLEKLIFKLLALDAQPAEARQCLPLKRKEIALEFPTQQQLLMRECDLKQLFGLLILAHYRTTPWDLRYLLDGPNIQTVLLRQGNEILAVALLAREGGFSTEMARQIWAGKRRPRGHLLAQSLSAHLGLPSAATMTGLRIMRIAVHPALQRQGLGCHMLGAISDYAHKEQCDYLGVSCGAHPDLIQFWQHNHWHPVRLGIRPGASSSHPSVMFLQAVNSEGASLLKQARARYARQLPALLGESLQHLSAEMVRWLLIDIEQPSIQSLSRYDWLDLVAFAFAKRGYDLTLPAIEVLTLVGLAQRCVTESDSHLLIKRVLQKQDWQSCALKMGMTGRKAVEERVRHIIAKLIDHFSHDELHQTIDFVKQLNDD
jgi:tRNA(Met) cytidine acetyltransferase